jgi:glycerophosphoryl diester phosphodiesterase
MLELDCHMTKDRQVVVHHDFALDRTTGQPGCIRDIEYDVNKKSIIMKNTNSLIPFLEITKYYQQYPTLL